MSRLFDRLNGVELSGEIVRSGDLSQTSLHSHYPRPTARPAPPPQAEFLAIVLHLLLRRKRTILGFFLLVLLLVSVASFLMKPKYEAVARVVFNRENANPLGFKDQ